MYTFQPLATIPADHGGFFIMCMLAIGILLISVFTEDLAAMVVISIPVALVVLLAWCVSYVWTDQGPKKVYQNTPVQGEFVRYVAEGYNESRTSGKSTRRVDVHNVYVVYKINGNEVLFSGSTGVEYPKVGTFYKN